MTDELQTPVEIQPSTDKIFAALSKFQAAVPDIPKNKKVKYKTKNHGMMEYMYADLPDILKAIRKPLSENGLAQFQLMEKGQLRTVVTHESGQSIESVFPMNTNHVDPKALGSLVTYIRRYCLKAALGLEPDEEAEEILDQIHQDATANRNPVERALKQMKLQPKDVKNPVTTQDLKGLEKLIQDIENWNEESLRKYLERYVKIADPADMTKGQLRKLMERISDGPPPDFDDGPKFTDEDIPF